MVGQRVVVLHRSFYPRKFRFLSRRTSQQSFQKKLSNGYTLPVYLEILESAFPSVPSRIVVFRLDSSRRSRRRNCSENVKNSANRRNIRNAQSGKRRPEKPIASPRSTTLFRKRIDLLVDWIGNMPRRLAKQRGWRIYELPPRELKPGDLIFLKHKRSCRTRHPYRPSAKLRENSSIAR